MPQDIRRKCGTRQPSAEERFNLLRLLESEDFKKGVKTGLVTIRVFVHVVSRFPSEEASIAEIQSQIDVLNQDFQAGGTGAQANAEIAFSWNSGDKAFVPMPSSAPTFTGASVRAESPFRSGFLNIWVCELSKDKGVATYPWDTAIAPGVAVIRNAFGTEPGRSGLYRGGRTATHEVGHWLGLLHVRIDALADTQPIMPEAFMSGSSVDADMELFTADQVAVMRGFLFASRSDTIV